MSLSLSFQPTVLFSSSSSSSSHNHTQQQQQQQQQGGGGRIEEGQLNKKEAQQQQQQQQPLNQNEDKIGSGPLPTKRFAVELVKPEEEDQNKRWNTIIEQFQAAISAATAAVTRSPNVLNEPFALGYVASGLDACLNWLSLGRNHFTESVETTTTTAAVGNVNILTEESLLGILTLLKHTFSLIILPSTDPNYTQSHSQLQSHSPPTKIKPTIKGANRIRATDSPDNTKDDFAPDSSRSRKRGRPQRSAAIVDGNILRGLIVQSCGILDGFAAFIDLCIVSEPILHMLASTALSAVFAGGRALGALQMSSIRVLTSVASCSAAQRDSLIADVILNISQYPGSAAALRLFKATTEESDQNAAAINVVSALVLALIQSCGTRDKGWHRQAERTVQHPYKHSIICAKKMVVSLIQQLSPAATANAATTVTAKPFLPYFVQDVLTVFNTPEWPCAELVLHLLVSGLIDLQHSPRCGAAIDLLGTIGARIRAESEPTTLLPPADAKGALCCRCRALLNAAMGVVLTCSDCGRSFHIECVPRSAVPDTPGAPWVCSDCATVRSIRADLAKIVSGSSDLRHNAHLSSDYVATTPVKTVAAAAVATQHSTGEVATSAEVESAPSLDKERRDGETPLSVIEALNLVNKQLIHNYLVSEVARTGSAFCEDARRFLVSQWSAELFQEGVSLSPCVRESLAQFYSAHWVLSPTECSSAAASQRTLPRDAVLRAVRIVGAEHGVMRSFDAVLACVLRLLGDAQATVRARAVRTLGEIVCAAQGSALLSLPVVQRAVQMRLIDTAVSVRQQAVDLVGRHITQCHVGKEALALYFGAIVERASDTGVSVRKQAVRILEGVCLSREIGDSNPLLVVNACKCLARRVVADDESVKAMVLRTFRALWFSPAVATEGGTLETTAAAAAAMRKRAEQIVAVVSVSYSADRGEWLQLLFASVLRVPPPSTSKSVSAAMVTATSVRDATAGTLVCEQLCEAFMDLLVSTESRLAQRNGCSNNGGGSQNLQRVMAWTLCSLRLMCGVAPNLLCKHVLNIVPYIVPPQQQQQTSTQEEGEIACAAMAIVEATFPLMQGVQDSVLDKTERDLVALLTKTPAPPFNVVRAAVRCLGVIVTRVRPNAPLMTRLFTHFYTLASTAFNNNNNNNNSNGNNIGSATPDAVLSLYALGYLCQSYDFDAAAGGVPSCGIAAGCVSTAIRTLYTSSAPGSSGNIPLEARRLQGYGAALGRWPTLTNDPATTNLFSWALRSNDTVTSTIGTQNQQQYQSTTPAAIQETALVVITELLRSRVELIGDEERAKPLALAGTSLACTHSKAILGLVVNSADVRVRNAAVGVADLIARHGVVDPGLTVPSLIAMLAVPANAPKAYSTLSYILEKYPGSLGPRLAEGIALSYSVQTRTGGCGGVARAVLWPRGNGGGNGDENDGGCSPHILVGRLFSLVKSRSARIAFVNTLLRPLEDVVEDPTAIVKVDPLFLAYVAEIAAFLPLETQDELHLICAKADHAILLRGAEATDILKKSIISSSSVLSPSSLTSLSSSSSSILPSSPSLPSSSSLSSSILSPLPSSASLPSIENKNENDEMMKSVTLTFAVSIFVTLKEFMRKVYGNVAKSFAVNNTVSNASSSSTSSLTTADSTPTGNSKLSVSIETVTFGKDISGKDSLFSEQINLLNSPAELRNFFKSQLSGDDADKDLATKEFGKYNRSGKRRGGGRGRKKGKDVTGPQQIKVEE